MTSVGETGGSGRVRRIHRGIIHQEDSLSSSRWFTTDEAGRMLHVTDALLSLGTLQVASRSVRTRKSRGPRFKREHALFLSLSLSRIEGYGEPEKVENKRKGFAKVNGRGYFPHLFLETLFFEQTVSRFFGDCCFGEGSRRGILGEGGKCRLTAF